MIENIKTIQERINAAATRAGRNASDIVLIAVTKTFPVEDITAALHAGITHIGESKIQEAQLKFSQLPATGITKHLIGHLQTNKAKKAVELFDLIQTVDSMRLADEIERQAALRNKVQDCLIEVKVSEEPNKAGCAPAELAALMQHCADCAHLNMRGLMTIAPYFDSPEQARPYFAKAKKFFDEARAQWPTYTVLSMGMSDDFEVAIQEGATMVRIGSAIFGKRDYGIKTTE